MSSSLSELVRQRSMLVILIAACANARTAFEAADNIVDADLVTQLGHVIERSELELNKLNAAIRDTASG